MPGLAAGDFTERAGAVFHGAHAVYEGAAGKYQGRGVAAYLLVLRHAVRQDGFAVDCGSVFY